MDETICIDDDISESSIIELEVPKRETPPLIEIEDFDDIILNVDGRQTVVELAEDVIKNDPHLNNVESQSKEKSQEKKTQKNMNINHPSNPSNSRKKSLSHAISPSHWTIDMIKFYNDDWGNEKDFSVENIQKKMNKNPALWEISRKDILFMHNRLQKSHIRCSNCGQHGHRSLHCPEPPYVPKCHMCGIPGHVDNSCPNSICLNCGNKTHEYTTFCPVCEHESERVCSRCLMKGHHFINCTDNWRLYHLTTSKKKIMVPKQYIYKNEKDIWCCNCGRQGHFQIFCPYRKYFASFMDTYPFVASYQNAFNDHRSNTNPHKHKKAQPKNLQYKNPKNESVFMNINNLPNTTKKNIKTETLLKFNPLNNVLKKETVKKKKKKKNKKKRKESRIILKQENAPTIKQETKIFLPLGL